MFSPIWGKGNGRGISGFAVNRGAVNRGFTVLIMNSLRNKFWGNIFGFIGSVCSLTITNYGFQLFILQSNPRSSSRTS